MAESVTYAPVPESKPKISRDRTAVVLAMVTVLPLLLNLPATWIEGRLNWTSDVPLLLSGCISLLVYLITGISLLIRVLARFMAGTAMQRVRWTLLLALVAMPVLARLTLSSMPLPFGGYTGGFASWMRANADTKAIRQWGATVPLDVTRGTEHPEYWMGYRLPGILFVPVVETAWPGCVSRIKPKHVYVLSDRSAVILYWPSGHG